jgi:hypothetical protein
MKHADWLVVVTLVALSGMAAAQRIGSTGVVAQVPFEFMVANKIVPAGEWVVQAATMDGKTLVIRNTEAKVALLSPSSQAEGKEDAAHYALIFTRYGDRYFLSGIKLEGSNITYRLPESKVEAELRAQNTSATEETLLASLK